MPLLFGTVFISLLFFELSEANRLMQRELLLKDMMITYLDTTKCRIFSERLANMYKATHDQFYKVEYHMFKRKNEDAHKHLTRLLKKVPSLQNEFFLAYSSNLGQNRTQLPFLQRLQGLWERQNKAAHQAMDQLRTLLYVGMFSGILLSALLALFFCLNITNRLLVILANTVSLSKGSLPSLPLKGNDEIAELDQFLFKSATEIRELERFKKEMIGVVSHELKSPLSSVTAFLSSLQRGVYGELIPKAKDKVERTHNSALRLMGLVRELLYLDRLELDLSREMVSIDSILSDSIGTVKELSEQCGIEIVFDKPSGSVFADRNRIVQVVVNLISNAMKFSPPQGRVTVETKLAEAWFECRVSDQGPGIPEDFRQQIFEPFKQIDTKDGAAKKGTGLGLTISKSIIEQHGGEIGVDSVEGKGSTFWFKIPASVNTPQVVAVSDSLSLDRLKQEGRTSSGTMGRYGVLKKGLIIIAVPLLFQVAFVALFGIRLNQIEEQTRLEENSNEIFDALSSAVDILLVGDNQECQMYVTTQHRVFKKHYDEVKTHALALMNRAKQLSSHDPERTRDIAQFFEIVDRVEVSLQTQASKNKAFFDTLFDPEALEQAIESKHAAGKLMGPRALDELQEMVTELVNSGASKYSAIELMNQMHGKIHEVWDQNKPGFEANTVLERLLDREKARGEKLAKERSKLISTLQIMFLVGIVFNIGLSVFLAFTLMRSLRTRLQHVMANTAHIVKRETLDPPIAGSDEIAHLDLTLYKTGMHLFELETFKQDLISIVSHELRTPLLSISAALELFSSGAFGELSDKGSDRLKFAQEECSRLIRLINDLLDIEKMEAGKFVLDKTEFAADDLIKSATAAVLQLAELKQIRFQTSSDSVPICADRDRLYQVLVNLLSNAIKYSPENEVIKIRAECKKSHIEFRVEDRGRGIPDEAKQKIFDRFVQVEEKDASERGGTGLGLAISKALVEQHGGSIGVESKAGEGSVFWFQVPAKKADCDQ